ncbi:unnamed protein product [Mytilus coruscus]|uniref:B box-type domain-containing protein n=1 Tax=Mytilus coruscus TaxID=42192 RepID=A0A6J8DWC6_MYTCO|nr:unnamed protein product [Mytilus coruscus]
MRKMATSSPVYGICDLRHISQRSVVWCPECNEGLCGDCKEYHSLSKLSRNDIVISVSDYEKLPSDVLQISQACNNHNEQFQMYCKKHDRPCCRRCISETHNSCKEIFPIDDIIQNVKTSSAFEEIEQTLIEVAEHHIKITQNRETNLKSIKGQKEKIQKEILQVRLSINSHLDLIQDNLIQKLNEVEEKECLEIRNLLKSLRKKKNEIKELKSNMDSIRLYASDLQAFLAKKLMNEFTTESSKEIQKLVSGSSLKEAYLFLKVDKGLEGFSTNFQRFGDVFANNKPSIIDIVQRKNVQAQLEAPKLYIRSIDGIKLTLKQTFRTNGGIKGCVILSGGKIAITCWSTDIVSIFNKVGLPELIVTIKLGKLFDATYNPDDNTIAVSSQCRIRGHIHIICMAKRKITKTISFDYPIGGIVYRDGYFVFCAGSQGINIRDASMTTVVTSSISSNAYITSFANYIYYTDFETRSVTCCDLQGKSKWTFKEESILPQPLCVTVDNEGQVYVVDNKVGNVVVISPDGHRYRQLLSTKDGITNPWALSYDRSTDRLLFVNWMDNAYLYTVTK